LTLRFLAEAADTGLVFPRSLTMASAKVANTDTLRALNALAVERGLGLTEEGLVNLDPNGEHVGVCFGSSKDYRVVLIGWMVKMRDEEKLVPMILPVKQLAGLPDTEIPTDTAESYVEASRRFIADAEQKFDFVRQSMAEIERLTGATLSDS
jgi:hypothetical protein